MARRIDEKSEVAGTAEANFKDRTIKVKVSQDMATALGDGYKV